MNIQPTAAFPGSVLIIVPHMDDCVLACGSMLAQLPDKTNVRVVYATDGMASPAPVIPWRDKTSADLGRVRMEEAKLALSLLGVPAKNIHFLGLPDSRLSQNLETLKCELIALAEQFKPDHTLIPFRFDQRC